MIPNRSMTLYCSKKTINNIKRILNHIKKLCQNKGFCHVVRPAEDTKILEFNQYQKSDKTPFVFYQRFKISINNYVDLEYLIKKRINAKIILKNHLQQK